MLLFFRLGILVGALLIMVNGVLANEGCNCGSTDAANSCSGKEVSYSRQGRTISFEFNCNGGACACGQFANDWDYWVAPNEPGGTVTITQMSPATTGIGTSNLRHGAEADPQQMSGQGFKGTYPSHRMTNVDHSRTIRVPYAVSPSALGRPTVILKSITNDDTCIATTQNGRMCLEYVETLTVLDRPPGNVFRPPYFGTEKPLIPATAFNTGFLPELSPVAGSLTWKQAIARVQSPHLEHIGTQSHRQGMTARINTQATSGYEQFRNGELNRALLKLTHAATSVADQTAKQQLAKHVAQLGIDLYHVHKNGGGTAGAYGGDNAPCGAWIGAGGFGGGKLVPIILAANLLDQPGWLNQVNTALSTRDGLQCFAETGFIQPNPQKRGKGIPTFGHLNTSIYSNIGDCNGANRNCASVGGSSAPSYANYDGRADGDPLGASGSPTAYQRCCTHGNWLGAALTVWLTPQVRESFPPNARHFLEYMEDRKRLGDSIGFEFAAYSNPSNNSTTGFNSNYGHDSFLATWDAYKDCFKDNSCPGIDARPGPRPPRLMLLP